MSDMIDLRHDSVQYPATPAVSDSEAPPLSWITHITPPPHPQRTWYAIVVLIISAVLVAVFLHDFLFTVILVLGAIVLSINLRRPHHPASVQVHATGISIDDEHHHFADMKSFWIHYEPHIKSLSIEFKKGFAPMIRIPLQDSNPVEIRRAMISYVPEKEHEISLVDHLIRYMGL